MSRSRSQQDASRANGAKSQGPVTPEGKERSSRNATKHGLYSDSVLLEPENRAAWNQLAEDLIARFQPADNVERGIIHDMAVTQWRKARALNIERAILDMEYAAIGENEPGDEMHRIALAWSNAVGKHRALDDLSKQSIRLGNYWMRLHKKLKELQAERKAAEAEARRPFLDAAKTISKIEPGGASLDPGLIVATETILRVISRFPGLVEKVEQALIRQPDQIAARPLESVDRRHLEARSPT